MSFGFKAGMLSSGQNNLVGSGSLSATGAMSLSETDPCNVAFASTGQATSQGQFTVSGSNDNALSCQVVSLSCTLSRQP